MSTAATAEATATEAPKEAEKKPATKMRKMRGRNKLMLILLSLVMMAVLRTGFMFIIIAMMPTIVAYYIDVSKRRYTFKTILACNLSGVMPFIGKMLAFGPGSTVMQEIMGDATNWFLIYGSALIGFMLVKIMPMLAHVLITGFHSTQVTRLNHNQKRIENEWGQEVTQFSKPDDHDEF